MGRSYKDEDKSHSLLEMTFHRRATRLCSFGGKEDYGGSGEAGLKPCP